MVSKRKKVLELLTQNDLTNKEIQEKTGYDLNLIQIYTGQYLKAGKIKKVGDKDGFRLYRTVNNNNDNNGELQFLKELVNRGAIKFYKDQITPKELERLEAI